MAFYHSIRLDKNMYGGGGSFSRTLEEMDPSSRYEGTEDAVLDAYQRQLKRFDIKVGGSRSDVVEKFFQTADSAALFPEYVARAVRQGMEEANLIPSIVAATTRIDGMDYRTITSAPTADEKSLRQVAEGAFIPETSVRTQENLVRLHKRGRMLVSSYEALRFQRLDLFTVTLKQIGAYIARTQLEDAVEVLVEGDGNKNPATVLNAATPDTLAYGDLINLWSAFEEYEMNTLLVSPAMMQKMLNLEEFKAPQNGLDFLTTGKLKTPFGAQIFRSSAVPDDKIIGFDKRCALELVQAGEIQVDYDKLIDRQLERAAITCTAGFAKIFADAVKVLEL